MTQDLSHVIFENNRVKVSTLPLDHRIYTNGFLFEQKTKERPLDAAAAQELGVSLPISISPNEPLGQG